MKHLNDNQLITSLDSIVRREREILAEVLNHFKEFDRRKLFSKLGYGSLHEYAVKHLKYSDDQAYRRVQAMRLLREIPEIETKIENGALTLSSLSQAQSFFRKVEHSKDEKREILAMLENTSKKEAQKIFQQEDKARYSFEADKSFEAMIEEVRGFHPHLSFDQLMKKVWEIAYEKLKPSYTNNSRNSNQTKAQPIMAVQECGTADATRAVMKPRTKIIDDRVQASTRYIPVNLKREVWFRAQGMCQNCGSTFALEYDHIVPFAKGGQNTKENLRVLCRSCNQRRAIEHYGSDKMDQYLMRDVEIKYCA